MTNMGNGREFDLIREFLSRARFKHADLQVGPGDDCAIITSAPLAVGTDMSVDNIHFNRAWLGPQEIGYRAVVAALSDLAAMAALPVATLVSFAFTEADADGWAADVMEGALAASEEYAASLAGGDVTRAREAVIDVVVLGKADRAVLRSKAQPGDEIWVTGKLGGAAAALASWKAGREPSASARERFARPAARTRAAISLNKRRIVHAMIDLSDGIAGDARHIAAASACKLVIDAAALPRHEDATLLQALQGGEDYELCFAAAPGSMTGVDDTLDIQLTRVGEVVNGEGIEILNAPDFDGGYLHFK